MNRLHDVQKFELRETLLNCTTKYYIALMLNAVILLLTFYSIRIL